MKLVNARDMGLLAGWLMWAGIAVSERVDAAWPLLLTAAGVLLYVVPRVRDNFRFLAWLRNRGYRRGAGFFSVLG